MEKQKIKELIIGVMLTFILILQTITMCCFASISNRLAAIPEPTVIGHEVVDGSGKVLDSKTIHEIPARMTFRSAASLDESSNNSITINAVVRPAAATDKYIFWTIDFVNENSTWATGKTVTDYVTVTPSSEGSTTATILCKKPFGEQIIITARSRDNGDAKAECTVDFRQQVTDIQVVFDRLDANMNKVGTLVLNDPTQKITVPPDTHYLDCVAIETVSSDYTVKAEMGFDVHLFYKGTEEMSAKLKSGTGHSFTNNMRNFEFGYPTHFDPGDIRICTDYNTLRKTVDELGVYNLFYIYTSNQVPDEQWMSGAAIIKNNTNIPYMFINITSSGFDEEDVEKTFYLYPSPELFTVPVSGLSMSQDTVMF